MTTPEPAPARDAVKITQADREAAADWLDQQDTQTKSFCDNVRNGRLWTGEHPLAQAFARHRLAALTEPRDKAGEDGLA